eukprot:3166640-Prymnesium_polylepis.1
MSTTPAGNLLLTRHHVEACCCAPAEGRNMMSCDCRGARDARPWSGGVHVDEFEFVRTGGSIHPCPLFGFAVVRRAASLGGSDL